jgi:hypothetical protein
MRRSLLLLTTMALGVLMVSSVAQAASPSAKCQQAASLGISGSYNFVGGSDRKNDDFTRKATDGVDVFCGFGGNDEINTLDPDDIFIGGAGVDSVIYNNGTFIGGADDDYVYDNTVTGTFDGGVGIDTVDFNDGTFDGGAGNDYVLRNNGTFNGGDGVDSVFHNYGTFNGNAGDDTVDVNQPGGTFNQEDPPA